MRMITRPINDILVGMPVTHNGEIIGKVIQIDNLGNIIICVEDDEIKALVTNANISMSVEVI